MSNIRRSAYFLMLLVAGAFTAAMVWKPTPAAKYVGLTTADIPARVGEFVSQGDYEMSPEVKAALSSADIVSRSYSSGTNVIDFILIGGTDRSALHDPRSCLAGAGWRLEDDHTELLPGTNVAMRSCHAVDGPDGAGFDMLYLYVIEGRTINKVTQIRTQMLWSALLGRKNTPVHFLRFVQPFTGRNEAMAVDHARLQRFAGQMWNALGPKLIRSKG